MTTVWPWLALAGLGSYHGLNPAMGWLFAVALGLHRGSRAVVLRSLVPIALGHTLAVGAVAGALVVLGFAVDAAALRVAGGFALMGLAGWLLVSGGRHRARVGMRAGFAGLALWSFLMAGAHGAGLMLVPALIPLCLPAAPAAGGLASNPAVAAVAAVAVHTAAMLAVTAGVAIAVYEWIGVEVLRRAWINLEAVWMAMLAATGLGLLVL